MATIFRPLECVSFVQSTKIGTHENKAINSIKTFSRILIVLHTGSCLHVVKAEEKYILIFKNMTRSGETDLIVNREKEGDLTQSYDKTLALYQQKIRKAMDNTKTPPKLWLHNDFGPT